MSKAICLSCLKPKANLSCGICDGSVCKNCAKFLNADDFTFIPENLLVKKLTHSCYCEPCFFENVTEDLQAYRQTLELAKNVTVFLKDQGKESRLIKRFEVPVVVEDCEDEAETLMRLAFLAVREGCNGLVGVDITYDKVRIDSYQKSIYRGLGYPADIDEKKIRAPRAKSPSR